MKFSLGKKRSIPSVLDLDELPYTKKKSLFTREERLLLSVLKRVFQSEARILAKVQISSVVDVDEDLGKASREIAQEKIASNCFDFLLCHPNNYSVFCAVEVDGKSGFSLRGRKSEKSLDEICLAADIPLVRVTASTDYDEDEIRSLIKPLVDETDSVRKKKKPAIKSVPSSTEERTCPACQGKIVKRTVKKGKNSGVKFWTCSNFPKCKHIEAVQK